MRSDPVRSPYGRHHPGHSKTHYSTHASSQLEQDALDRLPDAQPVLSPFPAVPYQLGSQSTIALSRSMTKTGSSGSEATAKDSLASDPKTQADTAAPDHPSPFVHCKHFSPAFDQLGWHRYVFGVMDYGAAQAGLPLIPMTYTPGPAPVQLRPIWAFAGMTFLNCLGFLLAIPWILFFLFLFVALALASLPTIFLPLSIGRDLAPHLWTPLEYIFAYGAIFGLGVVYSTLWLIYAILFVVFWPFNAVFNLPCSQWLAKRLIARLSRLRWPATEYKTRNSWVEAYFDRQPASTDIVSMAVDMFNNAWFFLLAWPGDIALRLTFTFLGMPQYTQLLIFLYIPGWTALGIFIMRKFKKWVKFNFKKNVCQQAAPSVFEPLSGNNDKAVRADAADAAANHVHVLRPSEPSENRHEAINVNDGGRLYNSPYLEGRGVYGHAVNDGSLTYGSGDASTSTFFHKGGPREKALLTEGGGASPTSPTHMVSSLAYDSRFVIGSDNSIGPVRSAKSPQQDPHHLAAVSAAPARQRGGYDAASPNVTLNLDRVVTRNDGGRISGDLNDTEPEERLAETSRSARSRGMSAAGAIRKVSASARGVRGGELQPPSQQQPLYGYRHRMGDQRSNMQRLPSSDADESFETADAHGGGGGGRGGGGGGGGSSSSTGHHQQQQQQQQRTIRFIQPNERGYYH